MKKVHFNRNHKIIRECIKIYKVEFDKEYERLTKKPAISKDQIKGIITFVVGMLIFSFGGWSFIFGKKISLIEQMFNSGRFILQKKDVIFDLKHILIRINDSYYGVSCSTRFFDSPPIQFGMLFGGIYLLYMGIRYSLFED